MISVNNKFVFMGGKKVAELCQSRSGVVTVKRLPSCSIGTYLSIIMLLSDIGYEVK